MAVMTLLLLIVATGFSQSANEDSLSQKKVNSSASRNTSSKQLLVEIVETDWGVGGTNQLLFLRVFSDQTVEFHPRRSQALKKARESHGEISKTQLDMILNILGREDVMKLPRVFNSTFTPKDFYWTLDMKIPRRTQIQEIKLVNFSPEMARENNKPYPEALVRLACTVLALRRDLKAETPYPDEDCKDFVSSH
ncbi:MAG: hypothetical protein WCE53_10035 [Candidatus Acidiferrum sp.]